MKKINLVELLKNCPTGMELDCTMFDNVTFIRVDNSRKQFPIEIMISGLRSKYLTKEGCFHDTTLLPEAKRYNLYNITTRAADIFAMEIYLEFR